MAPEPISVKYTEVPPIEYEAYNPKEFAIQAFVLGLIFFVRLATLMISNGPIFNATKKVSYLKKVIAIAWIRYMILMSDQQQEIEYEVLPTSWWSKFYPTQNLTWYILIG